MYLTMVDPAFGKNAFNSPKYYNETQTAANNILTILFGRPGFYPSIPDLGMDITTLLYRHVDEIDCNVIKAKLVTQCTRFLTNIREGSFDVQLAKYMGKPLLIFLIPIEVEKSDKRLAIGITTGADGKAIYQVEYHQEVLD